MVDISMCENQKCPLKLTCYRFNAKPSSYQSYVDFKPDKDGKCEGYWYRQNKKDGKKSS